MASQKQKATSAAVNNEYDYTLQTYGIGQPFFSKHVGSSTAPTKGPEKYQKLPESPEDDEAARKAEVLKEAWAAGYRHLLEQAAPGEKWECPNPDCKLENLKTRKKCRICFTRDPARKDEPPKPIVDQRSAPSRKQRTIPLVTDKFIPFKDKDDAEPSPLRWDQHGRQIYVKRAEGEELEEGPVEDLRTTIRFGRFDMERLRSQDFLQEERAILKDDIDFELWQKSTAYQKLMKEKHKKKMEKDFD